MLNVNGIGWPSVPMASRPLASPFRMLVKTVELQRAARVAHGAVADADAGGVEGTDAGVEDAVGAGVAAREHQLVGAIGRVVIDARVELRLRGALVREVRVLRAGVVRNRAHRAREGVRRVAAGRDLVGPAIVDRAGVRGVDAEQRAGVELLTALGVAVERAERDRGAVAVRARAASSR